MSPVAVSVEPSKVRFAESSSSPLVPARTTRPEVRSETAAEASVADVVAVTCGALRVVPLKVSEPLSSRAPEAPARTTRPLVRSDTTAEPKVASLVTSSVEPKVEAAETLTLEALTLVTLMSASSATSTPLEAAEEVMLEPPVIDSDSVRRSICSEPESPVTVRAVPTEAVVADVIRPFASTVITGTAVVEP